PASQPGYRISFLSPESSSLFPPLPHTAVPLCPRAFPRAKKEAQSGTLASLLYFHFKFLHFLCPMLIFYAPVYSSSIFLNSSRNLPAALENGWNFFHTSTEDSSSAGRSGRNTRFSL